MIKRIVGLLAAAAVLAVIVFTISGAGTYTSFFERAGRSAATSVATPDPSSDRHVNAPANRAVADIPADTAAISGTADSLPTAARPAAE